MPSELKTAILEDDNLNLPELNNDCSQATHFSRLGLPSDEAMDEYEHMRTSTVPSDGLANNSLRNGMHGFILSNEDSEKLISSSPPVRNSDANGYGELPPHPSSMQDELLDDVLPSSIFPTDDTDSQRTRLARHSSKEISVITRKTNNPIATPTAWREVRDDDMSVFMLSSESGFDEGDKKPPSVHTAFDNLSRQPSASSKKQKKGKRPSLLLCDPAHRATIAKLVEKAIQAESTKSSPTLSSLEKSPDKPDSLGDPENPLKHKKSPSLKDQPPISGKSQKHKLLQATRKRRKKVGVVIPPFPEMQEDGEPSITGKESIATLRSSPIPNCQLDFTRDGSELSEPRRPSLPRRPSSVKVDEAGSPIPIFPGEDTPEAIEIPDSEEDRAKHQTKKRQLPVRRSTRVRRPPSESRTPVLPMTSKVGSHPRKKNNPVYSAKDIPSEISLDRESFVLFARSEQKKENTSAKQTCSQSMQKVDTTSCRPATPVRLNKVPGTDDQTNPRLQSKVSFPEVFSLRPTTKDNTSAIPYVPYGVAQDQEPSDLRLEITTQIQRREERRRVDSKVKEASLEEQQTPPTEACAEAPSYEIHVSPLAKAVTQTTSNVLKYIHSQESVVDKVVDEYRQKTAMLVQKTREMHLQEAEDLRVKLETNNAAFIAMCDAKLKIIQKMREEALERQDQGVHNVQLDFDQLDSMIQGAIKALHKLKDSLGVDDDEAAVSLHDFEGEISSIINEAAKNGKLQGTDEEALKL